MNATTYVVILVYSTSHAIRAEKVLNEAHVDCKLIPVPRHISSDCGVCVRVSQADQDAALQALEAARVEVERVQQEAISKRQEAGDRG
ncbi:MAG: DUF3343 domain-containing protein [Anaerolineae bacterium]|nr:DUF3343 domain-containing protein [Anaerolineae bacterium]